MTTLPTTSQVVLAEQEFLAKIGDLLDEYLPLLTPYCSILSAHGRDPDGPEPDPMELAARASEHGEMSLAGWVLSFEQIRFMGDGSSFARRLVDPRISGAHAIGILSCSMDL